LQQNSCAQQRALFQHQHNFQAANYAQLEQRVGADQMAAAMLGLAPEIQQQKLAASLCPATETQHVRTLLLTALLLYNIDNII
jgi:hypothetical protein